MTNALRLDDYDFDLPEELIAQEPTAERDGSRLMVVEREGTGEPHHQSFRDLSSWLRAGDLLVVNATRVLPARLRGRKQSGGSAEALILGRTQEELDDADRYRALVRTNGRLRVGLQLSFGPAEAALVAEIERLGERGEVVLRFQRGASPYSVGEAPLPPYIRRPAAPPEDPTTKQLRERDLTRYQTVFARVPGAVAAPTAGLHLTPALLEELAAGGVERAEVVLHVGAGTFRPIGEAELASGRLHSERYVLPQSAADAIARTRERGGRVVAVGTTSARVLESRATEKRDVTAGEGETDLLLAPGRPFLVVDALLTNFHLPRSSLLLLVAAFAGRERALTAYAEAVRSGYRFYSYGDAMLIV